MERASPAGPHRVHRPGNQLFSWRFHRAAGAVFERLSELRDADAVSLDAVVEALIAEQVPVRPPGS